MLRNYFKIALRNLLRHKLFAFINIAGLAIGIVSCILIYIYVKDELSFDAHHARANKIYRLQAFYKFGDTEDKFAITPYPVIPALLSDYPSVSEGARLLVLGNQMLNVNDKMVNIDQAYYADTNFFKIFDYEFIQGNAKTALAKPENIVLTDADAMRLFGKTDVLHKTIVRNNNTLTVSGVVNSKKYNTHIEPGAFLAMTGINPKAKEQLMATWGNNNSMSYIVLNDEKAAGRIESDLTKFVAQYVAPDWERFGFNGKIEMHAEPLKDIHFNNYLIYDSAKKGNKAYVNIFIVVAVLILFISCINFVNMSTAAATRRSKEVAVRKVMGAQKKQLVFQFMSESLLIACIALIVSFILLELSIPLFNQITEKEISFRYLLSPSFLLFVTGMLVAIGVVAGSYPAFYLSGNIPNLLLKDTTRRKNNVRKSLMVLQFIIAIFMITGTLAVYAQIHYLKTKDLGFKTQNIVAVTIPPNQGDSLVTNNLRNLKNELKAEGYVSNASFAQQIPGQSTSRIVFKIKGKNGTIDKPIAAISIDGDFPQLMGMRLMGGRYLTDSIPLDLTNNVLVNEATARMLNWKDPLTESVYLPGDEGTPETKFNVVGVLADFHFASLHSAIEPLVIFKNDPRFIAGYMTVEIQKGNTDNVINKIRDKWKSIFPNKEFEYTFLDDSLQQQYLAEDKLLKVFGYFAAVAIILTIMGLYGLSFFNTQQRTKEIGIRKVMGAGSLNIIMLINREFIVLLCASLLLAVPASWYFISQWLNGFAYHAPFSVLTLIIAFISVCLITVLTVSIQVSRTAVRNPVKSLRYE